MRIILISYFILSYAVFSAQTTVDLDVTILEDTQMSVLNHFYILSGHTVINNGALILKGSITNNGDLSYNPTFSNSSLSFEGSTQEIFGINPIIANNVVFNNRGTVLTGTLQIDNDAIFTNGIINTERFGGTLLFNELSDHLNTSSVSFVNGQVSRNGALDFIFPIGDSDFYRPLTIKSLTEFNSFTSAYFSEDSNTRYPHENKPNNIGFIDNKEYWELIRLDGNDFPVIEIARDAVTSSRQIMDVDLNALHIVRWDAENNAWVDEGGLVNRTNNAIRTISNVRGYGIYALATLSSGSVLEGGVVAYNNLSPNGDGVNDILKIVGIENFPDNKVEIFNRWGAIVYEVSGYNNEDKVFRGIASSSLSLGQGVLPSGTYYYALRYTVNNKVVRKLQYLYINGK